MNARQKVDLYFKDYPNLSRKFTNRQRVLKMFIQKGEVFNITESRSNLLEDLTDNSALMIDCFNEIFGAETPEQRAKAIESIERFIDEKVEGRNAA